MAVAVVGCPRPSLAQGLATEAATGGPSSQRCPRSNGPWVDTFFAGDAWTSTQRDAVLAELRAELGRRSLEVCYRARLPAHQSENELTLVALSADEVRIVPARLNGETAWQGGRSMQLASLPLDARPLAIALAADEVLRGRRRVPRAAEKPAPESADTAAPSAASLELAVGVATRAPAFTGNGERHTPLVPGLVLRGALLRSGWGGSLGAVVSSSSEWRLGNNRFQHHRLPFDVNAVRAFDWGAVNASLEAGLVLALLQLEYVPNGRSFRRADVGGRLGARIAWGRRFAPYVAASVEVMPRAHELRLIPDGAVGHSAQAWAGVSLGLELRLE